MNILFINIFFVGFMVSEIPRVSVFGHCPYSVTFPYIYIYIYMIIYTRNFTITYIILFGDTHVISIYYING